MRAERVDGPEFGSRIDLHIYPGQDRHRPADLSPSLIVEPERSLLQPGSAEAVAFTGTDLHRTQVGGGFEWFSVGKRAGERHSVDLVRPAVEITRPRLHQKVWRGRRLVA